jgi:hypothetical protein
MEGNNGPALNFLLQALASEGGCENGILELIASWKGANRGYSSRG